MSTIHISSHARAERFALGVPRAIVRCVVCFLSATTAVAQVAPLPDSVKSRIEAYVAALESAGELSGTLLVGRGADIVYERVFGMADYAAGIRNEPTTLFGIASVTKPLTGIVTDRLVAEGKLELTDPVSKWIVDFPRGSEITIAHLRQHRSGIPHRVTQLRDELVPQSAESMARLAGRQPLRFSPGAQYLYSSAGFSVLARVLELATGKSYNQLLIEYVFQPLGTTQSFSAGGARPSGPTIAKGYLRPPDGPLPTPDRDLSFLVGAGSVYSTPRDLFRIVRGLASGAIATSYRESMRQGLYWNGVTSGFRAFVAYSPQNDVTVIWTGNVYTGAADLLRRDIPLLLGGGNVPPPQIAKPAPVAQAPEVQQVVEGEYEIGPGQWQELRFLSASQAMLGTEYLLIAVGEGVFFSPQDYGTLTVEYDAGRAVTGLRWESGPTTLRFARQNAR